MNTLAQLWLVYEDAYARARLIKHPKFALAAERTVRWALNNYLDAAEKLIAYRESQQT